MTTIEKIIILMDTHNISGAKLQKKCELPNSAIAQWTAGKSKPGTDAIVKIAQYFNVSTDYLLGLTDHERPLNDSSLPSELEKIISAIYETDLPLSDEELNEIIDYIHFIREKRKKKQDIPNIQPPSIQQEYAIGRHGGQVKVTQEEIDELEKIKPLDKKI